MSTITEKTVREFALENPASIRVFESLGIDYCCGGNRSLSEACSRTNHEVDSVLELLEAAARESTDPEDGVWNGKPLQEIIEHIVEKHHAFVRQETNRVTMLLTKVVAKHGSSHPELAQIDALFNAIGQELSTHMLKEEQVLFPYIAQMERAGSAHDGRPVAFLGSVKGPIAKMVSDHDDAGALLAQIRRLSNGFTAPAGACPTYVGLYQGLHDFERDLHHHVHLENNILFPRAIQLEQAN